MAAPAARGEGGSGAGGQALPAAAALPGVAPIGAASPARALVLALHLGVVWFVWGTSYVAIAWTIEGLPPFAAAALRFALAGTALLVLARWRGLPWPRLRGVVRAAPVGLLLMGLGDGGVIWATQYLPSGQVAVLGATTPLFMVLMVWVLERGAVGPAAWLAAACGIAGTVLVAGAGGEGVLGPAPPGRRAAAFAAALASAAGWALGSALLRREREPGPRSLLAATGLHLMWGAVAMAVLAAGRGEWGALELGGFAGRAGLALGYLTVFSCVLGFTSYAWLVRHTGPALAGSFAYVNPVVALWAGHLALGEPLGPGVLAGTALVLLAVLAARHEERRRGVHDLPPGGGL